MSANSGPQDFDREPHHPDVDRNRHQEDRRERRAVDHHQADGAGERENRQQPAETVLHGELAHLPGAVQPPLNVARSPAAEIEERQRQQLAGEEVQDGGVDVYRGETEADTPAPGSTSCTKTMSPPIAIRMICEQADVVLDDHRVHHDLREHREQQLEQRDHDREQQRLQQHTLVFADERRQPGQRTLRLRCALERVGIVEQRRVAGPLRFELLARDAPSADRRIVHAHARGPTSTSTIQWLPSQCTIAGNGISADCAATP